MEDVMGLTVATRIKAIYNPQMKNILIIMEDHDFTEQNAPNP
jgi:hypothetical protein